MFLLNANMRFNKHKKTKLWICSAEHSLWGFTVSKQHPHTICVFKDLHVASHRPVQPAATKVWDKKLFHLIMFISSS